MNSTIVAPPAGTNVVCTFSLTVLVAPSLYTRSKISPITWKEEILLGPPTPKNRRTVSPTLAFILCSFVSEPTAPLKV